jgi:hypothetical protein
LLLFAEFFCPDLNHISAKIVASLLLAVFLRTMPVKTSAQKKTIPNFAEKYVYIL